MADTFVSGGRLDGDVAQHDLYTCAGTVGGVVQITACNGSALAVLIRVSHAPAGAGDSTAQDIVKQFSLGPGDSWSHTRRCAPTDKIRVVAGTASVIAFTYDGIETS